MKYPGHRMQVYRDGCGGHDPAYPWFVAVTVPDTDKLDEVASFSTHAQAIDYASHLAPLWPRPIIHNHITKKGTTR